MDLKEIGHEDVEWFHMGENGAYLSFMNTELRFCVSWIDRPAIYSMTERLLASKDLLSYTDLFSL